MLLIRAKYLFRPKPGETPRDDHYYHDLFPQVVKEISVSKVRMLSVYVIRLSCRFIDL